MVSMFVMLITGAAAEAQRVTDAASIATVLYSGTLWEKHSNAIEGEFRIVERTDGTRALVLSSDFSTKAGPDLKLVLSPRERESVTRKNVLAQSHVVAAMRSPRGAQEYELPGSVDLSRYKTLAVHCEKYTKLWGAVELGEGEVVASAAGWTTKHKATTGGYEIVRRDDGLFLRFSPAFKTPKAPEPLRVLFSPLDARSATSDSAERGATVVAELRSVKGAQEYRLPEGIELQGFRAVLLNCKKYTKLWSAAVLDVTSVRE